MANEATLVQNDSAAGNVVHNMTVADGVGINKGTVLKLTDPNTASASDGDLDVCAGIAASEKVASDGNTQLGVHKRGIFEMVASGAITVGAPVGSLGTTNYVKAAYGASGAAILGYALETATTGETINVRLNL